MKLKDWKDITLSQYYKIKEFLQDPDEYTPYNLLDTIYDIDSTSLKLSELSKYNGALDFIGMEVPTVNLKDKYEINGTVYCSNLNLTTVTAAQFIDYQNYSGTDKFEDYLSVFFIPEGHSYNDGYDIEKTKEDLRNLDFPTVKSTAFFFTIQFVRLQNSFLSSLKKDLKKMGVKDREQRKLLKEQIDKLEQLNLESFQLL